MEWIRSLKKKFFSSPEYKEEMKGLEEKNPFDKTVANSLANHEHNK